LALRAHWVPDVDIVRNRHEWCFALYSRLPRVGDHVFNWTWLDELMTAYVLFWIAILKSLIEFPIFLK
jgi:hypothetical protein